VLAWCDSTSFVRWVLMSSEELPTLVRCYGVWRLHTAWLETGELEIMGLICDLGLYKQNWPSSRPKKQFIWLFV
jgi:hypothetical protein